MRQDSGSRFKRIEERKRFRGVDKIEVASEADRVAVETTGYIVNNLKARLAVKIRIAAIDPGSERVGQLQVRLGRNRRESNDCRILRCAVRSPVSG